MQKVRKTETERWLDTTLHPVPIKRTEIIIVPEETVFMQTLTVLPLTPIIFGFKHFDTEAQAFLSSCPELKSTYKCWVI